MKSKKVLFISFVMVIIMCALLIPNKVYAANATISASNNNVKVGTSVTISASINSAASWSLDVSASGGSLTKSDNRVGNSVSGENESTSVTIGTFVANSAGTYTITLSGYVVNGDDLSKVNVSGSTTITVTSPEPTPVPTSTPNPNPTPVPTSQPTSQPSNPTPVPTTQPNDEPEVKFTSVTEYLFTRNELNIKESYTDSSNNVKWVAKEEPITRIAIGDNNWSKVNYNGYVGYVPSASLMTDEEKQEIEAKRLKEIYDGITPQYSNGNSNDASNSLLENIEIKNVTYAPVFNSTITSYIANVKSNVDEIEVIPYTSNKKAKYEVTGNKNLKMGDNIVKIVVTSEDGTSTTEYQIKVIKGEDVVPLNALIISAINENEQKYGVVMETPEISGNTATYTIKLDKNMNQIEFISALKGETYEYENVGVHDLNLGENEYTVTLKIKNKGESEKTAIYKIKIENPEKTAEEKTNLKNKIDTKLIIKVAVITLAVIIVSIAIITILKKSSSKDSALYDEVDEKDMEKVETIYKVEEVSQNDEKPSKKKNGRHF